MSPEPIEYRIVLDVQTALRGIAVSDGYHYDVVSAAVKLDPDQDVESMVPPDGARPLVIIEVSPETWVYHPASQVVVQMPIRLHWIRHFDSTADESFVQTYFRGCADLERALALRPDRGGLARDTRIVNRAYDKLGGQIWAKVDLSIQVDRTFGAPDA